MFLNSPEGWSALSDGSDLLRRVRDAANPDTRLLLKPEQIVAARERELAFYRSFRLVEFALCPDNGAMKDRFAHAFVYALVSDESVQLLDGQSAVLHRVRASDIAIDSDAKALDYTEFFCSFVAGEEGPFFIVHNAADFAWPSEASEARSGLQPLSTLIAARRRELGHPATIDLGDKDIDQWLQDSDRALEDFASRSRQASRMLDAPESLDGFADLLKPPMVTGHEEKDGKIHYLVTGDVWYGGAVFRSNFRVASDGMVEMISDEGLSSVPAPRWNFARGLAVLGRSKTRLRMSVADAMTRLERDESAPIENVRIEGDLDLSNKVFKRPVIMRDVQVTGEMKLDNVRFEAGLRLRGVEVIGRVIGSRLHALFLDAPGLKVHGLFDDVMRSTGSRGGIAEAASPNGLSLRQAVIAEELTLAGANIQGGADLRHLRCDGPADLSGIRVAQRWPFDEARFKALAESSSKSRSNVNADWGERVADWVQEEAGLDMRDAWFESGLRLDPAGSASSGTGERAGKPAEIAGPLNLESVWIDGALSLRGIATTPVDATIRVSAKDITQFRTQIDEADRQKPEAAEMPKILFLPPASGTPDESGAVVMEIPLPSTGGIRLGSGEVTQGLDLSRIGFSDDGRARIIGPLLAKGLRVGRTLSLEGAQFKRARVHEEAVKRLPFPWNALGIGSLLPEEEVRIDLSNARLGAMDAHWLELDGDLQILRARIDGSVSLWMATIQGSVEGYGVACQDLHFGAVDLKGGFNLNGARIAGMLDGDSHSHQRTRIGGDVVLSGGEVTSDTRFCGAEIGGNILIITGHFHRIQMRGAMIRENGGFVFRGVTARKLYLGNLVCASLDLHGMAVEEEIELEDVEIESDLQGYKNNPVRYLSFNSDDSRLDAAVRELTPIPLKARWIRLDQVRIGGSFNLAHVECGGRLTLRHVAIEGDFLMPAKTRDERDKPGHDVSAKFSRVEIANCTVGGSALLDGCRTDTGFTAKDLTVADDLAIDTAAGIAVPGQGVCGISLPDLDAARLTVKTANGGVVNLERARIGIFRLEGSGDPGRLNLSNAQVEDWDIADPRSSKGGESDRRCDQRLTDILSRSRPVDQSIMAQAERWLRRRGNDEEADRLYRKARWAAVVPKKAMLGKAAGEPNWLTKIAYVIGFPALMLWRNGRARLIGAATGFWTHGARLLILGNLVLLPLNLIAACTVENIAPSTAQLSEQRSGEAMTRAGTPVVGEWPPVEVARLLVANIVPIVPIISTPRWEFAESRPLILRLPLWHEALPDPLKGPYWKLVPAGEETRRTLHAWQIPGFSPASLGLLTRIMNWIAWPLFLIGFAANIQRRREAS